MHRRHHIAIRPLSGDAPHSMKGTREQRLQEAKEWILKAHDSSKGRYFEFQLQDSRGTPPVEATTLMDATRLYGIWKYLSTGLLPTTQTGTSLWGETDNILSVREAREAFR